MKNPQPQKKTRRIAAVSPAPEEKLAAEVCGMNINKKLEDKRLVVAIEGRLDTMTAPELEASLKESLDGVEELVLDCNGLDYISSAGLRVLLSAQKRMNLQGAMKVTGVNETVQEIFEITGFSDILTIE